MANNLSFSLFSSPLSQCILLSLLPPPLPVHGLGSAVACVLASPAPQMVEQQPARSPMRQPTCLLAHSVMWTHNVDT